MNEQDKGKIKQGLKSPMKHKQERVTFPRIRHQQTQTVTNLILTNNRFVEIKQEKLRRKTVLTSVFQVSVFTDTLTDRESSNACKINYT